MKLTPTQHRALRALAAGFGSAYAAKVSMATLWALSRRGLADPVYEPGHMAFPRNGKWRISDAGLAALESQTTK